MMVWVESDALDWGYDIVLGVIFERLTDAFGVSRAVANVQLYRQHLYMPQTEYLLQNSQLAVAF